MDFLRRVFHSTPLGVTKRCRLCRSSGVLSARTKKSPKQMSYCAQVLRCRRQREHFPACSPCSLIWACPLFGFGLEESSLHPSSHVAWNTWIFRGGGETIEGCFVAARKTYSLSPKSVCKVSVKRIVAPTLKS